MRKSILLLLLPVFTYAQNYTNALFLHNTLRDYYDFEPLTVSKQLSDIAQKRAYIISSKDEIVHDDSDYGESVFYTDEVTISNDYYLEATTAWIIDSGIGSLKQIMCDCKNVGFGISYNNDKVYVVAIYDKIYK